MEEEPGQLDWVPQEEKAEVEEVQARRQRMKVELESPGLQLQQHLGVMMVAGVLLLSLCPAVEPQI